MRFDTFPLTGGIDVATPVIGLRPGNLLFATNYELAPIAGYRRINGYERHDGQTSPSDFDYGQDREDQRALIQPVPGSGPVRGVFVYQGAVHAFRDTADGLNKKLYKATPTGWTELTTPVLQPGGMGEYVIHNFGGSPTGNSVYGVDGVNQAFELNGETYTEITTGAEPLVPFHVAEFRQHLFLDYSGGSLQNSALGNPLSWDANEGAGEIAVGDDIVSVLELQGGALGVFCKDRIRILEGTSVENFQLINFSETGAIEWTVQPLFNDAIYLDRQIQRMSVSDQFGNFSGSPLTERIRPLVTEYIAKAQASTISRNKNQYYLFNNEKRALVGTFNGGQLNGWTTLNLSHQFTTVFAGEDADGFEMIVCGGDDGYVYHFNKGASFDGVAIDSILLLAPNHQSQVERRKRYRKVVVESTTAISSDLLIFAEFDYGNGESPKSNQELFTAQQQGAQFDFSNWNNAIWSGGLKSYNTAYIDGHGRNIAVYIYNRSDQELDFNLESMTIGYDFRGQVR